MTDDFTALIGPDHWLGWLGDDPARAVRDELERLLREQVPTATLEWVRLSEKPEFLTGGRKLPEDPDTIIAPRAAFAVAFELQVRSDEGREALRGVFSWVVTGLDAERRDRLYLDLNAEMGWAAEALKARVYEPDVYEPERPAEPSPAPAPW
jgi:hypothetical protein